MAVKEERIRCNHRGKERYVHPKACEWHIEKKDPECQQCPRYQRMTQNAERGANNKKESSDE